MEDCILTNYIQNAVQSERYVVSGTEPGHRSLLDATEEDAKRLLKINASTLKQIRLNKIPRLIVLNERELEAWHAVPHYGTFFVKALHKSYRPIKYFILEGSKISAYERRL